MAKLTLNDLSSGSFTVDLLNANFTAIETAMENTLSRNGLAPNSMSAALDMNGNRILNLPTAGSNNEPVTYGQLLALGTLNIYTPANHVHTWSSITEKPTTFTPAAHTHAITDITNLQSNLNGLDTRLDALEDDPYIWVQAGEPASGVIVAGRSNLWFW
jgi:hypothetical protein